MASNVVKLRPETYDRVKRLARERDLTMQDVITSGIDALERQEYARAFEEDFARLRSDDQAWQAEQDNRRLWDSTAEDGLGR